MARNPEDIARAGVEKAIKSLDKASEKRAALQDKYDEAVAAEKRSTRELQWTASHPDLPEDFDLDEFRRSLAAPFDSGDLEKDAEAIGDAVESGEVDPDALEEEREFQEGPGGDGAVPAADTGEGSDVSTPATIDDGDDPWADEAGEDA